MIRITPQHIYSLRNSTGKPFTEIPRFQRKRVANWLEGYNVLPADIGAAHYTRDTVCTALVYEFERYASGEPHLLDPSPIDAQTHLVEAGIWKALYAFHGS
jgi:hypothetical protein